MTKPAKVGLSSVAEKQLKKIPSHIRAALQTWTDVVELHGVSTMRQIRGYRDHTLTGDRKGQRSVSLNKAYRVIYEEIDERTVLILWVLEVNKHDY